MLRRKGGGGGGGSPDRPPLRARPPRSAWPPPPPLPSPPPQHTHPPTRTHTHTHHPTPLAAPGPSAGPGLRRPHQQHLCISSTASQWSVQTPAGYRALACAARPSTRARAAVCRAWSVRARLNGGTHRLHVPCVPVPAVCARARTRARSTLTHPGHLRLGSGPARAHTAASRPLIRWPVDAEAAAGGDRLPNGITYPAPKTTKLTSPPPRPVGPRRLGLSCRLGLARRLCGMPALLCACV